MKILFFIFFYLWMMMPFAAYLFVTWCIWSIAGDRALMALACQFSLTGMFCCLFVLSADFIGMEKR